MINNSFHGLGCLKYFILDWEQPIFGCYNFGWTYTMALWLVTWFIMALECWRMNMLLCSGFVILVCSICVLQLVCGLSTLWIGYRWYTLLYWWARGSNRSPLIAVPAKRDPSWTVLNFFTYTKYGSKPHLNLWVTNTNHLELKHLLKKFLCIPQSISFPKHTQTEPH